MDYRLNSWHILRNTRSQMMSISTLCTSNLKSTKISPTLFLLVISLYYKHLFFYSIELNRSDENFTLRIKISHKSKYSIIKVYIILVHIPKATYLKYNTVTGFYTFTSYIKVWFHC